MRDRITTIIILSRSYSITLHRQGPQLEARRAKIGVGFLWWGSPLPPARDLR